MHEAGSIAGIDEWRAITPDRHNDWIGQRSEAFQTLYPIGSKEAKAGKSDEAIFKLYSNGYKTSRDAYIYNFSRDACAANARAMVDDYLGALRELTTDGADTLNLDEIVTRHALHVRWDRELKNNLRRRKEVSYSADNLWTTQYRPFVKQHCYVDYVLVNNKYQMDSIFPAANSDNCAICVPGGGSDKPFSVFVVDTLPDLNLEAAGAQCFPRYRYVHRSGDGLMYDNPGPERIDNISDTALSAFRTHYDDRTITKDAIFDYVYGVLHAPGYRERFANDLSKELPRIPFAADFHAFADAGRALAALHLGYETCQKFPLDLAYSQPGDPRPEHYRMSKRAMRYADDEKTVLIVNDHLRISGIPAVAHRYQVNGRTPLEWVIDRYKLTKDKESGIVNDPNSWFDDPPDLIAAIQRLVHISVNTTRIVESLPEAVEPA